ncbi:MAG: hypothetical protein AAFN79_21175 [Pseudomonadota bacterium]
MRVTEMIDMQSAAVAKRETRAPAPAFGAEDVSVLNKLRLLAARARCASKIDAFGVCSLLNADPTAAAAGYAEALLRLAAQGLGHAPIVYHPGTDEVSRDEAVLLRLIASARDGDEDSLRFLAGRLLAREAARPMIFLCRNLAERLETF